MELKNYFFKIYSKISNIMLDFRIFVYTILQRAILPIHTGHFGEYLPLFIHLWRIDLLENPKPKNWLTTQSARFFY